MENCVNFHSQLASVMEVLANAAVAEICQLVDDGYAVLRLEISRTQTENLALKRKLRLREVRSQGHSINKSPAPLLVSCGATDHVRGDNHSITRPTTGRNGPGGGPMLLGDLGSNFSTIFNTEHPEVVLIKEEKLEEDLRDCNTQDRPTVTRKVAGSHSDFADSDQVLNIETAAEIFEGLHRTDISISDLSKQDPDHQASQMDGEVDSPGSQQTGIRHGSAGQCTQSPDCLMYRRAHGTEALLTPMEDGKDGVHQSCSYSVGKGPGKSLTAELPLIQSGMENSVSSLASLDWKLEAGGADSLKIRGGLHSAWSKGKTFGVCLAGVHSAGKDGENVQMGDCTTLCSQGDLGEGESTECKSSEPEENGLESSFDELFSPPEVAGIQMHQDGGGEGLPSYPYVGGSYSSLPDTARGRLFPERTLNCEQCGRLFSNYRDLIVHQRSHTGMRLFNCPQCKKQFLHLHQLKTHQRVHTGEKPFSCAQCGKRFSQSSHIKRHMSVHTGEKRYNCALCGKRFSQACSLKVHQSVHTGERPFSCTQCGKSFSVLGNLVRHQSVHIRK